MNYEDELEEILWNSLKEKFNIKDNYKLYEYILNRYFLIYNKNNINETKQFFSYIFNELNISKFEYKDCKLKFTICDCALALDFHASQSHKSML